VLQLKPASPTVAAGRPRRTPDQADNSVRYSKPAGKQHVKKPKLRHIIERPTLKGLPLKGFRASSSGTTEQQNQSGSLANGRHAHRNNAIKPIRNLLTRLPRLVRMAKRLPFRRSGRRAGCDADGKHKKIPHNMLNLQNIFSFTFYRLSRNIATCHRSPRHILPLGAATGHIGQPSGFAANNAF
jgi:hypothetical protein